MTIQNIIISALVFLTSAFTVNAQTLKMGDDLPLDKAVRTGRLDNGMTYFIRHNDKPAGLADFYIVYDVGAIQEEDTQSGLAHFLEHMAFNGSKYFPDNAMTKWLESLGMQFGTNINAATGMEMTYYQLMQVPVQRKSTIDSLLLILHDWSGYLTLGKKEIDKERGVIIEERRQRNTPQFRIGNNAASFVYGDTRYAHRDMLGSEEFLRTFNPKLLRDYYKRWYRPDLQAIVIVGDFDADEMEARLKKVMADIPKPEHPEQKAVIKIPDNEKPVVSILTDPEQHISKANFYIKRLAVPKELNNRVGANYMNMMIQVAASMVNIRLGELMQQQGCPFSSASMGSTSLTSTCDALELQVVARGEAIAEAFTSVYGELERIRRYGFTQEEFDFMRINILRSGKHLFEISGERQNNALGQECIAYYVNNKPMISAETRWAFIQLMMNGMTLQKINELMQQLITPSNNVLVISAPEKSKASLPKEEQLVNFFSWIRTQPIDPYKTEKVDKPLFSEKITPGKTVKTEKGAFGSTLWTLNNGIRVVVLPTSYSRNQIVMSGQAGGGLSTIAMQDYFTASMTAQIANMSGVGEFNSEQLRKVLGTKVASVKPSIGRFASDMTGSAAKADVETMLQLTNLYFTHPNFDRDRFDMVLEANRMNLQNSGDSPEFMMSKAMNQAKYGDNPRTKIPTEEVLKTIDFGKMSEIYRNFFTDAAGNYTFYFLGDIDLDALKPLVEKYLGALPAGTKKLSWKDDSIRVISGTKEELLKTRMQVPKSIISFSYTGDLDYTQQNTFAMGMLSACLQSRYTQIIREDKGGTYGVTVNGSLSRQPVPDYCLNISFQTAPHKADELVKIVKDELQRVAEKGPDSGDFTNTLEYWHKTQQEGLKTNQVCLSYLQTYYAWGEDWKTDHEKMMQTVTPESVRKLAKKILEDGNLKLVIMNPEK